MRLRDWCRAQSPSQLQVQSRDDVEASLHPAVSTSTVGRVNPITRALARGGPLHSGAGSELVQLYENHGRAPPAPYDRGFLPAKKMAPPPLPPPIEVVEAKPPPTPVASSRRGKQAAVETPPAPAPAKPLPKPPLRTLYAHVRGKTILVRVGAGNQKVFWLGASAVQRYLEKPNS